MSGREAILNRIRKATTGGDRQAVEERLAGAPRGIVPARGQLPDAARVDLFCQQAEKAAATVERVTSAAHVPSAVAAYLRGRNLPAQIRMGADERLRALPWAQEHTIEIRDGASDGMDEVGVSHAFAGIAETATVVLPSGADNPTTINFLPDHHIVVVKASEIAGDLETAFARVRERFGKGQMPRVVNLVTGPSRSGDIEQKLLLGAHGPRALHLIVVEDEGS
jgi:L-lactate dehydrogenase complex protein LldG